MTIVIRTPKRFYKGLKIALAGIGAAVAVADANPALYYSQQRFYETFPTIERYDFRQRHSLPLLGWKEDVEGTPTNIAAISQVLDYERLTGTFTFSHVRIESPSRWKRPLHEQLRELGQRTWDGHYEDGEVRLHTPVNKETAHHEIKHAKAYEVMSQNPGFLGTWIVIANAGGDSPYFSNKEDAAYRMGLEHLIEPEKLDSEANTREGFVSTYARRNPNEDIAETCTMAETNPSYLANLMDKSRIIKQKVALAEKHGLIPKGFLSYTKLVKSEKEPRQYLLLSRQWLAVNKNSVYECHIRKARAQSFAKLQLNVFGVQNAIKEAELGISAKYKEPESYKALLEILSESYAKMGRQKTAHKYFLAKDEYERRFHAGDQKLATDGVNDFLAKPF